MYVCVHTRVTSQPLPLQNFLFPSVRKRKPQNTENPAQAGAEDAGRSSRAARRGAPGLGGAGAGQGRAPRAAHAAAPPGRAAAAAAGHPQRAAGKLPRRPDGTAGPLLPLVQSTTCFGLHLVTGSMAGPNPPAPDPATDRSSSGCGLAPSHAPIPAAPLRAAPSPARLLPPAAGPPRCRSAPRCRVPPGRAGRVLGKCREKSSWGSRSGRSGETAIQESAGILPREWGGGRPGAAPRSGGGSA